MVAQADYDSQLYALAQFYAENKVAVSLEVHELPKITKEQLPSGVTYRETLDGPILLTRVTIHPRIAIRPHLAGADLGSVVSQLTISGGTGGNNISISILREASKTGATVHVIDGGLSSGFSDFYTKETGISIIPADEPTGTFFYNVPGELDTIIKAAYDAVMNVTKPIIF